MTDSTNNHEPSAEFRARLRDDIARACRSDERFGAAPSAVRSNRVLLSLGIAAGVVLTLLTGVVLGASASYASAAVPNGPRPTFAFLPVKDALNAIGCGNAPATPKVARAAKVAPAPVDSMARPDSAVTTIAAADPDRARIAELVKDHQHAVSRGDSTAEYVVMVLDSEGRYVWSTSGTGAVAVQVAGDSRSIVQRREYTQRFSAEFWGAAGNPTFEVRENAGWVLRGAIGDSLHPLRYKLPTRMIDSGRFWRAMGDTLAVRSGGRGGRGGVSAGGAVISDSNTGLYARALKMKVDSLRFLRNDSLKSSYTFARFAAADSLPSTYVAGWFSRASFRSNSAPGLRGMGGAESGIVGLPSASIAGAESYGFAAGELAPQALKVLVVRLQSGARWTGR